MPTGNSTVTFNPACPNMGGRPRDRTNFDYFICISRKPIPVARRTDLPDWGNELVSSAGYGLNERGAALILSQDFPEDKDILAEVALFHKTLRPQSFHQLLFFQQPSAVLHEKQESIERFRCDW